jgi:membrane protease subunit HflC
VIGDGEAQATRVANDAHAADPAFYQFLKTLETYRAALDSRTTLVLSAESTFLRLLTHGTAEPSTPSNVARNGHERRAAAAPAAGAGEKP